MSDAIEVPKDEHGKVRLFSMELPEAEVETFASIGTDEDGDETWPLGDALGTKNLDPDHVDVVKVDDLGEMGLEGYLVEGMGLSPADVAAEKQRLKTSNGYVVIVTSSAFGDKAQTIRLHPPLRHLATFQVERHEPHLSRLNSDAAAGDAVANTDVSAPQPAGRRGNMMGVIVLVAIGVVVIAVLLLSRAG